MIKILNAFLGNKSGRDVKALTPTLIKIKEAYETISQLSNDELRAKTQEFKQQITDYIADKENQINEIKKKIVLEKVELLADVCKSCQYTAPVIYDVLIGEEKRKTKEEERAAIIKEFEKKPLEERWKYFQEQVSKCIRCYACRQACPNCYCKECFAEQTKPRWIGITDNISDIVILTYGLVTIGMTGIKVFLGLSMVN